MIYCPKAQKQITGSKSAKKKVRGSTNYASEREKVLPLLFSKIIFRGFCQVAYFRVFATIKYFTEV